MVRGQDGCGGTEQLRMFLTQLRIFSLEGLKAPEGSRRHPHEDILTPPPLNNNNNKARTENFNAIELCQPASVVITLSIVFAGDQETCGFLNILADIIAYEV